MRFPRSCILRRSILSTALLVTPAALSAADQGDDLGLLQGLITGRRATPSQQAANGSTSVQAELQKLFHTGQVQTSQHQVRAGESSVRHVQQTSSEEDAGLFRQIFNGRSLSERRASRLQERAKRINPHVTNQAPSVPKPPPIDYTMQQRSRTSVSASNVSFAREVSQPPGVPPIGASLTENLPDSRVTLKPAAIDEFVSPFIDDESLERKSITLDLDSLIDRPADRSEAMPITTEGDAVQRLIELPIPLKPPMTDPLLEDHTVTLPSVDEVEDDSVDALLPESDEATEQGDVSVEAAVPVIDDHLADLPVIDVEAAEVTAEAEESAEMIAIQSEKAPTTVANESREAATDTDDAGSQVDPGLESPETVQSTELAQQSEVESEQAPAAETRVRLSIQEENARRQQQRYLILSRAGRTGFKGFCPVALRKTRTLRDSSPNHTARFGLKTYEFSSEEARLQFEANPSQYAPAAGGSDVVLLANTGEETEGSLDFCLWYRDRLYMFRSRETQAIFSSDPARFANEY